jgi:hypothetical protein
MKTLDQLDTAIAETTAKVDQSNAKIDQANTKIDALAAQGTVEKFTGYGAPQVSSAGGRACQSITVPNGRIVRVESIIATTYGDAGATPYIGFSVKTGHGSARLMTVHLPVINNGSDPVPNTRSAFLEIPLRVHSGNSTNTNMAVNDVHLLQVCVQASGSATASSSFIVYGIYE